MSIVTLSDALIQRLAANDRRILRDRILSGFCLRLNKRSRTFMVATSASNQQVRITIGHWPLMSADEARFVASQILRDCRAGKVPVKPKEVLLPSLREILPAYAKAKALRPSSLARYESLLKVHFHEWLDCDLKTLGTPGFSQHCHQFARTRGAAIVELGRGLIGAIFKYINAIHGLSIASPFDHLAVAGLMPNRAEPRSRRLQDDGLPKWYEAGSSLKEKQRDLLLLLVMTGLRRNEGGMLCLKQIDMDAGVLHIPETKTGCPHSLPITPVLKEILERRMTGLTDDQRLFEDVSIDHLAEMAERAGAPKFMLHDLRKLLATTGERLGFSDAVMRRILNHKAKHSDTLHRHYVNLTISDIREPLAAIQHRLLEQMGG